mmetsp:Transcript_30127/g.70265  ORF Transcript_30127/g.70265 Transcript_30127/m.70265 type:complete len:524 (-) Transcript_30127:196-1767(-)
MAAVGRSGSLLVTTTNRPAAASTNNQRVAANRATGDVQPAQAGILFSPPPSARGPRGEVAGKLSAHGPSKRQPVAQDQAKRQHSMRGASPNMQTRTLPSTSMRDGTSKSPVRTLQAPVRRGATTGSLSIPLEHTTANDDEGDCGKLQRAEVQTYQGQVMAYNVPAMTPSTCDDGFSVLSANDHSLDARFREQEDRMEAMISGLRKEFAEREAQKSVAGLVPDFSEQLTSIVELAMKDIVNNLREDLMDAQQQTVQFGVDQLRSELNQEIDILQATVAGLREEQGRLEQEVAGLVERQTNLKRSVDYVEQARMTLKSDMANMQTELGRVRDRSESTMRKSMNNVDELRNVVGNLADMFRWQNKLKVSDMSLLEGGAAVSDGLKRVSDPTSAVKMATQSSQEAEAMMEPTSSGESDADRRLKRGWAPCPIVQPEECPLSPYAPTPAVYHEVEEGEEPIITPDAGASHAVLDPKGLSAPVAQVQLPLPQHTLLRSFVKPQVPALKLPIQSHHPQPAAERAPKVIVA